MNNHLHARKPNRVFNYDYSQNGAYFITICTKGKKSIFGKLTPSTVGDGLARPAISATIQLSKIGEIAKNELIKIPDHYPNVKIDCFVIMPNHVHAIIKIERNNLAGGASPAPTLGNIIGGYKSGVSRVCSSHLWQRSFHDHIIRNADDYFE